MGRNDLDLDFRGLQHERESTSSWHGFANAERRQQHRSAILPNIFGCAYPCMLELGQVLTLGQNCGFYAFYMFAGINFLLAVFVSLISLLDASSVW